MEISQSDSHIRIEVIERVSSDFPTPGDTRFSIMYSAYGFTGFGTSWVSFNNLEGFARELLALEATRKGEAVLESMSPHQFQLRVFATDNLGHMAVSGSLKHRDQSGQFLFPIDPSHLPSIAAEFNWLCNAGAQLSVQPDGSAFGGPAG